MIYENNQPVPSRAGRMGFTAFDKVYDITERRNMKRWLIAASVLGLIILLLPWTQNIRGKGQLTSLQPSNRPQSIQSVIGGRIEKWYVTEGQLVHKGDTILHISEIKDEYFDPQLLNNVQSQIGQKESAVGSYMQKVSALDSQIDALNQNLSLKLSQQKIKIQQLQIKITTDSNEWVVARRNLGIAEEQFKRFEDLNRQGLISETDLEQREVSVQNARAKALDMENKWMMARQENVNARTELQSIAMDYQEKINKSESEKYSAMSAMYDTESQVTKLQNAWANYNARTGLYYILSPQDGYITKAQINGLGETIKEGQEIVTIMPLQSDLAVEMYVNPMDLPLIQNGEQVRFIFDGWPSFFFSGWPGVSYGTFGGKVVAIDNNISSNGKFRILVAPDPQAEPWPNGLRVGGGAQGIALLNDVAIGYELWRQINGFPPDYYKTSTSNNSPAK
jgi:membrane fusion protein, adhesin transport system